MEELEVRKSFEKHHNVLVFILTVSKVQVVKLWEVFTPVPWTAVPNGRGVLSLHELIDD